MEDPLIAHVIFRFDYGGLENGLVNVLNESPARLRHAVICMQGYSDFTQRIRNPRVTLHALGKRPGKDLACYWRLWRLLRALAPSIVHTRNLGTLDCAWVARLAGVPATVHGLHGWDMEDLHGESPRYRRLYQWCDPAVSRYVVVSRQIGTWLTQTIKVASARVEHICNGVDVEKFRPGDSPAAPQAAGTVFTIGSVGRFAAVKNHETLIRAFAKLSADEPGLAGRLRLVLVGSGPLDAQLRELAAALGVEDRVRFTGSRDDIAQLMREFDLFVLPSLQEGISNTVLEAMASGCAVVATRIGGNPELVLPGETGALVAPGDVAELAGAIRAYAVDPSLARGHGAAGRRRAETDFSLRRMTARYAALYEDLLEGTVGGTG